MEFLAAGANGDLTYSDVFLVPQRSAVPSRSAVDLAPGDGTRATLPIVAANMNAVTGPRLAASLARRGGLAVLPQDLPGQELAAGIDWVKRQPVRFDSAVLGRPEETVAEALSRTPGARGAGIVLASPEGEVLGVVPAERLSGQRRDARLGDLASSEWLALAAEDLPGDRDAFDALHAAGADFAPVLDRGRLVGTLSAASALRSAIYAPHLDASGRLAVAAAIGVNGDPAAKASALAAAGVDVLVLDTAHGHQERMLAAIEAVAALELGIPIVAGNVVTAAAVRDLVSAGADILKVGVGPGAMCTTRMMTAVGRPQFSAVLETASVAAQAGASVWADGGVRFPRDVALALAAGAGSVMIGSWFTGTVESPGPIEWDEAGRPYKQNWGMASAKAVRERFARLDPFERAAKALFSEGISSSRVFLDPDRPSVEDLLDQITAGLRSACTYAGAASLAEFRSRAVVGVQSAAGYEEGRARDRIG